LGDASKAKHQLGWQPQVTFGELARLMADADLKALLEMQQCKDIIQEMWKSKLISSSR
jgi:hypothetical protein